jgi:hypothetical protein
MNILQEDRFNIEAVDLGKLYKVKIRHDNKNWSPAWYLDRVEITDTMTNEKFVFHCERWLAKNKDDCKIERQLYVKVSFRSRLGILILYVKVIFCQGQAF